jgi:hypothetical protein
MVRGDARMNNDNGESAFTSEFVLSNAEAVLAGTLALMTALSRDAAKSIAARFAARSSPIWRS